MRFENEPVPYARFCAPRNVTQWKHVDAGANPKTRFRTMNMTTFTPETTRGMPVGFTNQGISAAKTIWLKRQMEK